MIPRGISHKRSFCFTRSLYAVLFTEGAMFIKPANLSIAECPLPISRNAMIALVAGFVPSTRFISTRYFMIVTETRFTFNLLSCYYTISIFTTFTNAIQ